jgi:hypothetical protein
VEELDHLARRGCRGDDRHLAAVQAQPLADARVNQLVGALTLGPQRSRHRLAALLERDGAMADVERPRRRFALARVRLGGQRRLDAGLHLLPDPRNRREHRRARVGENAYDLARVGTARHRVAVEHRAVVRGEPVGDVRGRQIGDAAAEAAQCRAHGARGMPGRQDVAMAELDALRWSGRARRVDQRQQVLRADGTP